MRGEDHGVALRSAKGRGIVAATVLASGMAFLDGTVVNVALPTLGRELGASLSGLQWIVDAYQLTLSAFLLLGGALGDVLGRRRVFLAGTLSFAATSALCGLSPDLQLLCAARGLQGVAAALLVPGSLAILKSGLRREDQDAAIGLWAGLSGVTTAAGPLVGGWLVENLTWRSIFFLNLPLALVAVWTGHRSLPESRGAARKIDWAGGALAAACLGAAVYALIEGPPNDWPWHAWGSGAISLAALAAFLVRERRCPDPMLPLGLFERRQFAASNLATLVVYFSLSGATFLGVLGVQHGLGWSPVRSALVLLPVPAILLVLSPLAGRLAGAVGYRLPMTIGPALAAGGLALLADVGLRAGTLGAVTGTVAVYAAGLGLTVAPLTAAVLRSVEERDAGIASAVNNAVGRVAGLLGVAVLPLVGGVSMTMAGAPFLRSVRAALLATAATCAAGGLVSWIGLPGRRARSTPPLPPRRAGAGTRGASQPASGGSSRTPG